MTPVVLWAERLPGGPPKLVTFLPAFWLLVPGATGLIGTAAYRTAEAGYHQLSRTFPPARPNAPGKGDWT